MLLYNQEVGTMEKRSDRIQLKISPGLKERARAAAQAQGRTLSNYIEHLILSDLGGMKKNEKGD